ncbi:uncharacterized protein BBA_09957 [Beauveria bassiana ARSEF 2860]|uniref:Uncharacterized protein n=1 Tax=Beauveria bassiana (strain ARSEF 2860) TaxID=655819 RepID=J4VQZ6_BEAB2|nr:uncharacterized protein BBA_09957 [Beauveria bassiana ARSEF 2860]EJP61090.1 hypothetical protein BBA_09957 [Beauveria bassiana ARSEF 2860]
MARNVTRIENLIKKLNKADFCKVFDSSIRSRLANNADTTDIVVSLQETIAEVSVSTPAATPAASPAADSEQDHDEITGVQRISSTKLGGAPQGSQPNRKRFEGAGHSVSDEEANGDDSGCCQGRRKRRKHDATCTDGNSVKLSKANMIKPDPQQDLYNLWGLCKSLRQSRRVEELINSELSWTEQLPKLFDNAEKHIHDAKSRLAHSTLEWRLLAVDVANLYVQERPHEDERRSAWRAMGYKVHGTRDTTLDLLTGRIFGADVDMCLIAPGMRISQNAFKAQRAGQMETPFVRYLINTFESSKEKLHVFSQVMDNWVRFHMPPYPALMIEGLSEAAVRTQRDLSLDFWGQPASASVSGVTDAHDFDASDTVPARIEF